MNNVKVTVVFTRQEYEDNDSDVSYLEQDCFDNEAGRERLAAFKRGAWHMIGIRAVATVHVTRGQMTTSYTLESPGLWGIESDSEDSYLQSVFKEECNQLQADIQALQHASFKS